uniref:Uncharacterized protein n=1 Tax=Anguilla anguilla TaxID=7936 RepID=A0A0E9TI74_ANGAN
MPNDTERGPASEHTDTDHRHQKHFSIRPGERQRLITATWRAVNKDIKSHPWQKRAAT